jgi:diguanylate cyclase (GGDEF)-like protein
MPVNVESLKVDGVERTWSLQREWTRAFTIMLVLLLVAAAATFVGVRGLVVEVRGTANQIRLESLAIARIRVAITAHEEVAQKLLSGAPVDRVAYAADQHRIARMFDRAETVFPATNGMRATVAEAHGFWQASLSLYGLWDDQLESLHGAHTVDHPSLSASTNATRSVLDRLQRSSLAAVDRGLTRGAELERILLVVLLGVFGLALAATVYFRRRMAKDLVRPVATMRTGVMKLQAGEYAHRIDVARRDELGDLAEAFNGMAGALHDSYVALTLRATHDSLTGLANRASLTERLNAAFLPHADRRRHHDSVLFIDIDDFKDVNDSLGHEGGDALLVQLAERLVGCVGPEDLVARLGGDEFAIVVVEDDDGANAVSVAERILDVVREPFIADGLRLVVSVSIGLAQRRAEVDNAAELLRRADFAMYMAKGSGKGRYQVFDAEMHDDMVSRFALKAELAVAVTSGQLRLEYQPIADLRTGEVLGVEALVRWQHPTRGLLPPRDFINLAEESGDIEAIGCWVLDTASRQVASWRNTMEHCADLWVSVNLSAFQLPNPNSLVALKKILSDPAVQAEHLVLEVTETALAAEVGGGIESLNTLKDFGVRIAIDDFGTGFSSLSTLTRLPVDILKIDRSFVSGQPSASPSVPMLEGILLLADKLSLAVIAEGIEEPEQLDLLRALGCNMGQGYFLARPAPAQALEALLSAGGLLRTTVSAT